MRVFNKCRLSVIPCISIESLLTKYTFCHIINKVKYFDWNEQKNKLLKAERDISFEDVLVAIEDDGFLDILEHPNKIKYPNQKILIVKILNYAYIVPFIEDEQKYFLKTIFPSRKMTNKYLKERGSK